MPDLKQDRNVLSTVEENMELESILQEKEPRVDDNEALVSFVKGLLSESSIAKQHINDEPFRTEYTGANEYIQCQPVIEND